MARSADFSGTVTPHPWRSLGTFVVTKKRGGTEGTSPSRVYLFANRFSPSSAPRADSFLSLPHGRPCIYLCTTSRRIYPSLPFPPTPFLHLSSPRFLAPSRTSFHERGFSFPPRSVIRLLSSSLLSSPVLLLVGCSSEPRYSNDLG